MKDLLKLQVLLDNIIILWNRPTSKPGARFLHYLEEADCAEGGLDRLYLGVLGQQHVLDTRLAVVERAVPRHMVAAAKRVFC